MTPATPPAPLLLSPDLLAMMRRGVSVIASACGRDGVPSVMRAVGCRVSEDGSDILLYLLRSQSGQLLQDVADSGRIAVVFSSPRTHITVQVKSSQARVTPIDDGAAEDLRRYVAAMEQEIAFVGFSADFVRAMLSQGATDLVAVRLVPEQAFDQTPGARAGAPLKVGP